MLVQLLMLILSCTIVERMVTGWGGKFSKPTEKGDKWTILFIEGENQSTDPNFGEKITLQFISFETALSSLDFFYTKVQQTPQNPKNNDIDR